MTRLYEWPPTRSQRARWVLEEVGADYESCPVDLPGGEQHGSAYRAVHPLGVVPALETDYYTLLESVAIVLQVIDEHPEAALAPPLGTPERAAYYQWCVFAASELDPVIMMVFNNSLRPGAEHDAKLADRGRADFAPRAEMLCAALSGREYLVGSRFTGADLLVGHSCFMAQVTGMLESYPPLADYYARLCARPAHRRAYEADAVAAGRRGATVTA